MKILVAPDSFKGSLSSKEIVNITTNNAKRHFVDVDVVGIEIADGGEGTVDAVKSVIGGEYVEVTIKNPANKDINAGYLIMSETEVLIEMAKSSGINTISDDDRDIMSLSSFGSGQILDEVIKKGYKKINIAIGGTATNDAGIGILHALGVLFFDENDNEINPIPRNLIKICRIDATKLSEISKYLEIKILSDVKNPFLGTDGATHIYAKQKGANMEQISLLEEGMSNLAKVIYKQYGKDIQDIVGSGAGGGASGVLAIFLNAKILSGIETILEIIKFDNFLQEVDLIITGEGRVDYQSTCGKVIDGISKIAKKRNIPVIVIAGGMGEEANKVYEIGVDAIAVLPNAPMSLQEAMNNASDLMNCCLDRLFRILKIGMRL